MKPPARQDIRNGWRSWKSLEKRYEGKQEPDRDMKKKEDISFVWALI